MRIDSNSIFIKHQFHSHMRSNDSKQTINSHANITPTLQSDKGRKDEKPKETTYAKLLSNILAQNEDKSSHELARAIAESEKEHTIAEEQRRIQENYKQLQQKEPKKEATPDNDFEYNTLLEELVNTEDLSDRSDNDSSSTPPSSPTVLHK